MRTGRRGARPIRAVFGIRCVRLATFAGRSPHPRLDLLDFGDLEAGNGGVSHKGGLTPGRLGAYWPTLSLVANGRFGGVAQIRRFSRVADRSHHPMGFALRAGPPEPLIPALLLKQNSVHPCKALCALAKIICTHAMRPGPAAIEPGARGQPQHPCVPVPQRRN